VRFEFAEIKGAKIILDVKFPTFRTAKLKVFAVSKKFSDLFGTNCTYSVAPNEIPEQNFAYFYNGKRFRIRS